MSAAIIGGGREHDWVVKHVFYGVIFYYLPFTVLLAIWKFTVAYPPKHFITNHPPYIANLS